MTSGARPILALSVAGVALSGGALLHGSTLPVAYAAACTFWGGLAVGSLALLMIHRLTGGRWGEQLRRPLLASVATLPLLLLLLLPALIDPARLYPWAATAGADTPTAHPTWYLNVAFFRLRGLLYLAVWLALGWLLGAWNGRRATAFGQARAFSAAGLVILVATSSLAAFDWIMSLDPSWYSAVFGLLVGTGQVLAALAFAVLWRVTKGGEACAAPQLLQDWGNLLLSLTLLWSYLVFMQFLTVWIADLPSETRWYLPRLQSDWRWLWLAILVLHLLLPVPLLLSHAAKRTRAGLATAAALLLGAQAVNALWLTLPTLRPQGLHIAAADLAMFAGPGALWLALFLWQDRRQVGDKPALGHSRGTA